MSVCCSEGCSPEKPPVNRRYHRILWIALFVNAGIFVVELAGGWNAGYVSLLADAVDFFGDAANYGLSLFVLALAYRSYQRHDDGAMDCSCLVRLPGTWLRGSCPNQLSWV
ncbi:cation transporter [Noviherbaspirillum sp. ST9]|uniref:cation transporter n=1 Tax=Noviherbaspirillum sp. ST9 TaxID=3401606 RepID=UPI003B587854